MVSQETITSIIISIVLSIIIPLLLIIFFKWKYKISLKVVIGGMITFLLFSQLIGGSLNAILFINETTSEILNQSWIYVPYVALMAGLLEETGRFIMLNFIYKKSRQWKDGLAFGIGHGGIETILILGISNFTMLTYANLINTGKFEDLFVNQEIKESLIPVQQQLIEASSALLYFGTFERICAIVIHIALSILILYGIKTGEKNILLYCVLIHALFNIPAGLFQKEIITNLFVLEGILGIISIFGVVFIIKSRSLFINANNSDKSF
jgi:uncharacterized membrane protein YhfC